MLHTRSARRLLCGAVVVASTLTLAAPAYADDNSVLGALEDAQPSVLANVSDTTTTTSSSAAEQNTPQGTTTVPVDPADGIDLSSPAGSISIGLPFSASASDASAEAPGIVSFDNDNGSQTVPVVKTDGSVQVTTVIESADAPTSYVYPLTIPDGASATLTSEGAVAITDQDGHFLGGIAPAWAKDADGNTVATHYELSGTTLTQVVDLTSPSTAFPVVADPWAGLALVDHSTWVSRDSRGLTLEVHPTVWGRTWTGSLVWSSWWSELMSKTKTHNALANTKDMEAQLDCHLWFASLKDTFNLDSYLRRGSLSNYIAHLCN